MVKVHFPFFRRFLILLTKVLFREEDWALRDNLIKFWDFSDFSYFPKTSVLSCLGTRETALIYLLTRNIYTLFHWWWKENLLNHQNLWKYYGHGSLVNFLSPWKLPIISKELKWAIIFYPLNIHTKIMLSPFWW